MPFDLRTYSRFRDTQHVRFGDVETFGMWHWPEAFDSIADQDIIRFKVTSDIEGRPDLISDKFYLSPNYDWIIIMYNQPTNPLGWPRTGDIIKIPPRSALNDLL